MNDEEFQRNYIEIGRLNKDKVLTDSAFDKQPAAAFWTAVGQVIDKEDSPVALIDLE